jgi:hypothetical protein
VVPTFCRDGNPDGLVDLILAEQNLDSDTATPKTKSTPPSLKRVGAPKSSANKS